MRKNILLFILVVAISFALAPYFGSWYDKFSPQNADWTTTKETSVNFAGFLLSYIFFIPFIIKFLGTGNKKKWISWLLVLPLLFVIASDLSTVYIPILLAIIGYYLGNFLLKLVHKNQTTH